jgi:hypothetical protein
LPLKADCIPLIFSDRGGTEGGRKKGIMQTEFCRVLIANQSFFSLLTEVNSAQKSPPLKKKCGLVRFQGKTYFCSAVHLNTSGKAPEDGILQKTLRENKEEKGRKEQRLLPTPKSSYLQICTESHWQGTAFFRTVGNWG